MCMHLPGKNSLSWRYFGTVCTLIAGLTLINLIWSHNIARHNVITLQIEKAQTITAQFLAMRTFIAENQDRINYNSEGEFEFKHLNPAAVGKGVGDILAERTNYIVKQTRLQARNPANEPDDFERDVLNRFAADPTLSEYFAEANINGRRVFRYMLPLYVEETCLGCHGEPAGLRDVAGFPKEGLKLGELAGSLSLIMPTETIYASILRNRNNLLLFNLVLLVLTTVSILYVTGRLVVRPLEKLKDKALQVRAGNLNVTFADIKAYGEVAVLAEEFSSMLKQLKDLYDTLERKVASRTRELEAANLRLTEGRKTLLQLNQKLSENNRLKSEFMATITHELRTPLTSIVAFCELLLDEIPGSINAEQRENLLDIKTSSQQLMILISDILDMAKHEAGQLRLSKERLDINDVFRTVRRTMSAIANQNNIQLNVHSVNLPLVMGDPVRLCQMIINLISNAIKFSKEHSQIDVYAQSDGDYAAIFVQDYGEGIAPDLLPHIFEKFRQGDSSLKRRRSGTGLGLALVKTLSELQGGRVSVQTEVGKGTIFTIYIPFVGKEEVYDE